MVEKGKVKEYSESAGSGKVVRQNGEVMTLLKKNFHAGLESLNVGDVVSYNVVMSAKGLEAKQVERVG